MTQVETAHIPQFDPFELLPEALTRVQLRRIGRQAFQAEALGGAIGQEFLDRVATVDRCPSQMSTSRPDTSRRRCSRKAMTPSELIGCSWLWKYNLPSGETAEMADRWSRVQHSRKTGVWPMGAEVRTTLGEGEKPDPSTKRIACCCASALF